MNSAVEHVPVLLDEALNALQVKPGALVVDGTFGQGGHSRALLEKIGTHGQLLAIDRDLTAVNYGRQLFGHDPRVHIRQASFEQMTDLLSELGWQGCVTGILFDLGLSSVQLEAAERGFSFRQEGPLDMRMDQTAGLSVAHWLAAAPEKEIARVLKQYGDERRGRDIARAIVQQRAAHPITDTGQLARLVAGIVHTRGSHKHPATRTFLALRIQTNDELGHLKRGLEAALSALASSGRLVVISFHSLEDRIVKHFFRALAEPVDVPRKLPMSQAQLNARRRGRVIGRALRPSSEEVARNPRARSAVLRVFEKAA